MFLFAFEFYPVVGVEGFAVPAAGAVELENVGVELPEGGAVCDGEECDA